MSRTFEAGSGRYEWQDAATTTNAYAVAATYNVPGWRTLAVTIRAYLNDLDWQVYGDTDAAFGTERVIQAEATVAEDGTGTFTMTSQLYPYIRVKIKATVGDSQADCAIYGLATR